MLNKPAVDAYRVATYIAKIYTRLGVARDAISLVLDEAPLGFDDAQFKRINDLRNAISKEMGLINDFSSREAHRICNTDADPTPPVETFPQFFRGSKWLDEDAFVRFDSKDAPCLLFKNDGSTKDVSFEFDEIPENILKFGWVQLTEAEAMARIKPTPVVEKILAVEIGPYPEATPLADLELLELEYDAQIFPPDPVFIQVENSGIPGL